MSLFYHITIIILKDQVTLEKTKCYKFQSYNFKHRYFGSLHY